MELVITKFKSGGLHEKHVVATWNLGNHLNICFWAQRNQEKPVSRWPVAGPSEYWTVASSPAFKVKKKKYIVQQYTRSTNNSYPKYNIKLGIKHPRQIRIQHVQKVKTPKQEPKHVADLCIDKLCLDCDFIYIQGVTGGTDQTSGRCSLCYTIPI